MSLLARHVGVIILVELDLYVFADVDGAEIVQCEMLSGCFWYLLRVKIGRK